MTGRTDRAVRPETKGNVTYTVKIHLNNGETFTAEKVGKRDLDTLKDSVDFGAGGCFVYLQGSEVYFFPYQNITYLVYMANR